MTFASETPESDGGLPQIPLHQLRSLVTDHAEAIRVACVCEATAPKVGNVHPQASFDDCDFDDFRTAAERIATILAGVDPSTGSRPPLGQQVFNAIEATREVTQANVNLGIVLLIAPLAAAKDQDHVADVLADLTPTDGFWVYRAIALAAPGGVVDRDGNRSGGAKRDDASENAVERQWDVTSTPTGGIDLIAAMRQARYRDRIARQYGEDFRDFFDHVVPVVADELSTVGTAEDAIVKAQLRLLAAEPDSLIARKCGAEIAAEACRRAAACLRNDNHTDPAAIADFDRWLRADGNRRNPGTTADLIAAAIYWLIR